MKNDKVGLQVVFGGIYAYILWSTFNRGYPLFYEPLILEFNSNLTSVSQISAYFYIAYAALGALTPIFHQTLGFRKTVMILSFISATSLFISSFLNNITIIAVLVGMIPGLCMGPIVATFLVLVSKYPEKYASASFQIMYLGISLGPIASCPAIVILINTYTWRGALMFLSGFMLNLLVAGASLFQDVDPKTISTKPRKSSLTSVISEKASVTRISFLGRVQNIANLLQLRLFLSLKFWLYGVLFGGYCIYYFAAASYIVIYATQTANFSELQSATLISGLCAGDAISKVLNALFFAILSRRKRIFSLIICHIMAAGCFILAIFTESFIALMTACVGLGLASGGFIGCYAMLMVTEFDKDIFVFVNSYCNVVAFTMSTLGQLVIAKLIDLTGNPICAFYFGCGFALFSSSIQFLFYKLYFVE